MAAGDLRTGWQREDCPMWCVVTHSESDHPHDRKHVSAQMVCGVVALREAPDSDAAGTDRDQWYPTEIVIVLQRRDGTAMTGVYVGDGFDQRIEMTLADARRLTALLTTTLGKDDAT